MSTILSGGQVPVSLKADEKLRVKVTRGGKVYEFPVLGNSLRSRFRFWLFIKYWNTLTYWIRFKNWMKIKWHQF